MVSSGNLNSEFSRFRVSVGDLVCPSAPEGLRRLAGGKRSAATGKRIQKTMSRPGKGAGLSTPQPVDVLQAVYAFTRCSSDASRNIRCPCRGTTLFWDVPNRWPRFACHRLISVAPPGPMAQYPLQTRML